MLVKTDKKDVIARADEEYLAEGINHRVVICHFPFTLLLDDPFDIEEDIYCEWITLLRDYVHPDVIINGHMHYLEIIHPGDEHDHRNQPCPVVIGSAKQEQEYFAGAGFVFDKDGMEVCFTDNRGDTVLIRRKLLPVL